MKMYKPISKTNNLSKRLFVILNQFSMHIIPLSKMKSLKEPPDNMWNVQKAPNDLQRNQEIVTSQLSCKGYFLLLLFNAILHKMECLAKMKAKPD